MELSYFIEKFAEQFDETDISSFRSDIVFKELEEWSSLIALAVIAMIDEEYEVEIKGEDIHNSNTIEELFAIVKERK